MGGGEGPGILVGTPPLTSVETKAQGHTVNWGQSWGSEAIRPHSPFSAVSSFGQSLSSV